MRIRLTRLTSDRHRLEVERGDGVWDGVELETRSLLLHDLVHLAIERELGTADGFWGRIAAGAPLVGLREPELLEIERLVGPMQAVWNERLDASEYARMMQVTPGFVDGVRSRLRGLTGQWRATGYGETMEVSWP